MRDQLGFAPVWRDLPMRRAERLQRRYGERGRVVLCVEGKRQRHAQWPHAADERAVAGRAAEVADQLDATGQGVLLEPSP